MRDNPFPNALLWNLDATEGRPPLYELGLVHTTIGGSVWSLCRVVLSFCWKKVTPKDGHRNGKRRTPL